MRDFLVTGPVWLVAVVLVGLTVCLVYVVPLVARWIWNLGSGRPRDWEED